MGHIINARSHGPPRHLRMLPLRGRRTATSSFREPGRGDRIGPGRSQRQASACDGRCGPHPPGFGCGVGRRAHDHHRPGDPRRLPVKCPARVPNPAASIGDPIRSRTGSVAEPLLRPSLWSTARGSLSQATFRSWRPDRRVRAHPPPVCERTWIRCVANLRPLAGRLLCCWFRLGGLGVCSPPPGSHAMDRLRMSCRTAATGALGGPKCSPRPNASAAGPVQLANVENGVVAAMPMR